MTVKIFDDLIIKINSKIFVFIFKNLENKNNLSDEIINLNLDYEHTHNIDYLNLQKKENQLINIYNKLEKNIKEIEKLYEKKFKDIQNTIEHNQKKLKILQQVAISYFLMQMIIKFFGFYLKIKAK